MAPHPIIYDVDCGEPQDHGLLPHHGLDEDLQDHYWTEDDMTKEVNVVIYEQGYDHRQVVGVYTRAEAAMNGAQAFIHQLEDNGGTVGTTDTDNGWRWDRYTDDYLNDQTVLVFFAEPVQS